MIKVAFVRGAYLNEYETQTYLLIQNGVSIAYFSSLFPIHTISNISQKKLLSLSDLQKIPFFSSPIKFLSNRLLGDSQVLFGLEEKIKHYDIIHTADPHYYYSYQVAKLRKKQSFTFVSTWWETIPFNNEGTRAKKNMKKFTMGLVDHFICHTERARDCLIAEGIDSSKITVQRLCVDLAKFVHLSGIQLAHKNKLTVLFVGRNVWEKGLGDLKEAAGKLQITNFKFQIKFKFIQNIKYNKISKEYQSADIMVVPSKTTKTWEEQYGMVLLEAMASGLPVIAYSSGSIPEVLGNAGVLVPEGDTAQLSDKLRFLIENKSERLKLGTIGRKRVETFFDAKKCAKELEKFYKSI